jgi:TPP-dependent pyruvate/acetoin dehydrogenase alpha subunit
VEALTYRLRGHYEGDPAKYRELSTVGDWRERDPLTVARSRLEADGILDPEGQAATALEASVRRRIEAVASDALAGPVPGADDLLRHVYAV